MYIERTLPISIASIPKSLHWSITLAITAGSSLPQFEPSDQAGSYSNDSILRPAWTPSVISTSFLQATGQAWQVRFGGQELVAHHFAGDGVGGLRSGLRHLRVLGAERADRVDDVHQHVGAERGEAAGALLERAIGIDPGGCGDGRFEDQAKVGALGGAELVALLAALGAPAAGVGADGDDRLEVLGAGDRAGAAAAGGAVVFVHDRCEEDAVLAGLADGHD